MVDFDDEEGIIFFPIPLGDYTWLIVYTTSWWRRLLFSVGINCYYEKQEFVFKNLK
jgi:hypothetical protein